jgi:hypothetical protein
VDDLLADVSTTRTVESAIHAIEDLWHDALVGAYTDYVGVAHGDLNLRNALWSRHTASVTLIDFEKTTAAPLALDYISLEYELRYMVLAKLMDRFPNWTWDRCKDAVRRFEDACQSGARVDDRLIIPDQDERLNLLENNLYDRFKSAWQAVVLIREGARVRFMKTSVGSLHYTRLFVVFGLRALRKYGDTLTGLSGSHSGSPRSASSFRIGPVGLLWVVEAMKKATSSLHSSVPYRSQSQG